MIGTVFIANCFLFIFLLHDYAFIFREYNFCTDNDCLQLITDSCRQSSFSLLITYTHSRKQKLYFLETVLWRDHYIYTYIYTFKSRIWIHKFGSFCRDLHRFGLPASLSIQIKNIYSYMYVCSFEVHETEWYMVAALLNSTFRVEKSTNNIYQYRADV